MNIFWLDNELRTCASYHNDKHCVKMILEYAQLLSTAHRILDGDANKKLSNVQADSTLYKATHINHPCAVWARESRQNYLTLHHLFTELLYEYEVRYGKKHKTSRLALMLSFPPKKIKDTNRTPVPLCMPDEFKVPGNPVESYRNYYRGGKAHIAKWKVRKQPEWF